MIKKTYFLFIAGLFSLPFTVMANGSHVLKIVKPSMVSIISKSLNGKVKSGSGVIVSKNEILTNCHVIEDANSIELVFSDGIKTSGTVSGAVSTLDLCVINAQSLNRKPINVVPVTEIEVGQIVFAVGDPLSLKSTISDGIVSAIRQDGVGKIIQTTAPISPGSSGGGLFDVKGRLLGITTFTLTKGQNLNFAIPAEYKSSLGIIPLRTVNDNSSDTTGKIITFKGVPFGSSSKQLSESFNDTSCKDRGFGIICYGGGFPYLNLYAQSYSAFFKNDKLHSVIVSFSKSDSLNVTEDLKKTLIGYFGQPDESSQAAPLGRWEPNPHQSIVLTDCQSGGLFCSYGEAAKVELRDQNVYREKEKSDF